MEAQLKELLTFLRDKNPQVRQIALANLVAQTPADAPHRNLFLSSQSSGLQKPQENNVIRDLKLLCRDQPVIAHDAFKALINLSDAPSIVASLSDVPFLTFLVSYTINPQSILADLASMLLSNLSASATPCSILASLKINIIPSPNLPNGFFATQSRSGTCPEPVPYPKDPEIDVLALPLLLDAFVQGANVQDIKDFDKKPRKGSLHFLASVFANLASSSAGRDFFSTPRPSNFLHPTSDIEFPIAKIVPFTEHKDTIRRGGVVSTIKNFCFNARAHRALLTPSETLTHIPKPKPTPNPSSSSTPPTTPTLTSAPGADALPYLLLPLAGPEELDLEIQDSLPPALQLLPPDKTREPDPAIRLMLIEILLLCCHTRWGRDYMREKGVYEVVKVTHECEGVDKISEHIERLVQLLKGQEPPLSHVEEEYEYDALPEDDLPPEMRLIQGLSLGSSSGSGSAGYAALTGMGVDMDGLRISEVGEDEEMEMEIEPLGADSEVGGLESVGPAVPAQGGKDEMGKKKEGDGKEEDEDDDDDDKIVEV
ncbi:hypothetical protein GYMLUDRAFT_49994 [Collybiopsis luxurians FD-317 M1]|uniref:Protein HGH1 homolog n=1 Tax=Collybiopsis luxurians FD-317 M1 TaxID=944289 RepID=A0A0D0C382_9AGAR|nr:hypothetical protein GYMLUDRAFT_49994 [Collybiopsis luxurians FD-317 M1]